jgi:hypothetical protein
MPTYWADLTGLAYRLTYDALRHTDLWGFFRLREATRHDAGDRTLVQVKPGAFQQDVDLALKLDGAGVVRHATLWLRRSWVTGPPFGLNPMALDIAKSFYGALAPETERADGRRRSEAIAALGRPGSAQAVAARQGAEDMSSERRYSSPTSGSYRNGSSRQRILAQVPRTWRGKTSPGCGWRWISTKVCWPVRYIPSWLG